MKTPRFVATVCAVLTLVATATAAAQQPALPAQAHANSARFNGSTLNGLGLNGPGLILQGRTLNGPGLILQGRTLNGYRMNGLGLNGPGIVLQSVRFNGLGTLALANFEVRFDDASLTSSEVCMAPQPEREWPLSALDASSVTVRLAR